MMDQEEITRLQETIDADERAFQSMYPELMEKLSGDSELLLVGNACKKAIENLLNALEENTRVDMYRSEYNYVTERLVAYLCPLVETHIITEEEYKLLVDYFTVHMADRWYLHQIEKSQH